MRAVCVLVLCIFWLYSTRGDLYNIFGPCCHEGVQWSSTSYRCDNYPGFIENISDIDQAACLSVIEVCCIKQIQLQTCEDGKQTALDGLVCAIRDIEPGAEQFRECCHCCQLGLVSRASKLVCQSPGLGEPCDSKYKECCRGEITGNISIGGTNKHPSFTLNHNVDDNSSMQDNQGKNKSEGSVILEEGKTNLSETSQDKLNGDECNLFAGEVCSHTCIKMPRGFLCACPEDLHLDENDNKTCIANSEEGNESTVSTSLSSPEEQDCELNNPCEQQCISSILGRIECQCYEGYRLAIDETSCEDIDECGEGTAVCAPGQQCVNTRGRFTCVDLQCSEGLKLNPLSGQCESDVLACQPGFVYSVTSRTCEDINECGLGIDSCGTGERCENAVGSYVCRRERHCGTGYTLDEDSQRCIDNDECVLGTHNCDNGYKCQNIQGSFRCVPRSCPEGYHFQTAKAECVLVQCPVGLKPNEAGNCIDIDECEEYGPTVCSQHQRCINTRGSYHCRNFVNCPPGYEPSVTGGCQDIDECRRGTHKCGLEQHCINRQGTYFCQCPRGMRHDNLGKCVDVDECAYGAAICPSNSKCVNTIASFKCDCVDGLKSDENDACTDVDECETEGVCQQSCINVLGTFFCSCNRGYQLKDDKRSCQDIDECTQFGSRNGRSGICGGKCMNLPGSYKCDCPDGWRLKPDARSCEDINECKELTAHCPHPESVCINTRGSYKCPIVRCPDGFVKTNATGQQNSEQIVKEDGVICGRGECQAGDLDCLANKTKTVSLQFLALPSVEFITGPLTLLRIRTVGYSVYPNLHLEIISGNEELLFDTVVTGDKAALRLLRPLKGPSDKEVVLQLENRDIHGLEVISRHITHMKIFVGANPV